LSQRLQGKLDTVNAKLNGYETEKKQKIQELEQLLGDDDNTVALTKAQQKKVTSLRKRIARLEGWIAANERKKAEVEWQIGLQDALAAEAESRDIVRQRIRKLGDTDEVSSQDGLSEDDATRFLVMARRFMAYDAASKALGGPIADVKEALREFVRNNLTGWLDNPNVFKRYLFTRQGKVLVILQDVVQYCMAFTDVLNKLGLRQLIDLGLLKIDFTRLVRRVDEGVVHVLEHEVDGVMQQLHELNYQQGRLMTIEDWEAWRERDLRALKVVAREDDAVGDEKVVVVKPELANTPVERLPEMTILTGHHVNPLKAAGIHLAGQLKGWSLVNLRDIDGIGSSRGEQIIAEVTRVLG